MDDKNYNFVKAGGNLYDLSKITFLNKPLYFLSFYRFIYVLHNHSSCCVENKL